MVEDACGYRKEFIKNLTYLSKANNFKDAIKEWRLQKVIYDPDGTRCICKKEIYYLCHIINVENGLLTIIGSDCCKHIENSMKKQSQEKIDKFKNPHKWCKYCNTKKKKVRNEDIFICKSCNDYNIINFGKYKGYLYYDVYENHYDYCEWVLKKQDVYGELLKFKNYILNKNKNKND